MDKTIVVNIKKCLACRSCELACAIEHSKSKVLEEAIAETPGPQRRVSVESAGEYGIPLQCRHCDDAPCIAICPTGAVQRENEQSPVTLEAELCIGCKLCLLICPLGILQIDRQGRAVIKCDMCCEKLKEGELPKCVQACPTMALKLALPDEPDKDKSTVSAEKN